jgi:hypothetical protein
MKNKIYVGFIFFALLQCKFSNAQLSATLGTSLPASDTIRVLLIFAEVDCTPCYPQDSTKCVADNGYWLPHQLPPDAATWFDYQWLPNQTPTGYITKYYSEASFGRYVVLGDYYPSVIKIPCTALTSWNGTGAVIDSLNAKPSAITTSHGLTLDKFDMYRLEGKDGIVKPKQANDTIDVVAVIWRNNGLFGCGGGYGFQPMFSGKNLQN